MLFSLVTYITYITYIKGRKFPNFLSGYTETNGIHIGTTAEFILENDNKK
jgi:hypothetical protein